MEEYDNLDRTETDEKIPDYAGSNYFNPPNMQELHKRFMKELEKSKKNEESESDLISKVE